jgi:methionine-rich copper-binding protein CopC
MAVVCRRLGMFLLALLFFPSPAAAHSNEVLTNPDNGARLESLPAEATMAFGEAPVTADVVLASPDGTVRQLRSQIEGTVVLVRIPPNGPRGTYRLSYRVVSADGHPVSGSTTFTVTTGSVPSEPGSPTRSETAPSTDQARDWLVPVVLVVAILGFLAMVYVARSLRR